MSAKTTAMPLFTREWRASSRLVRTPWLLAASSVGVAGLMLMVALGQRYMPPSDLGRLLFHLYFGCVGFVVVIFGPSVAANAIALEREGKTWEALMMAGMAPAAIDRGKFLAAYTHLALYLCALLPAAAIPHFFGGVSLAETALGLVVAFAFGALCTRIGLVVSAVVTSARIALLSTIGLSAGIGVALVPSMFALSDWFERQGMESLSGTQPFFWPIAIVHESVTGIWFRYLVVVPIALGAIAWLSLRELTVGALTTRADVRSRRLARAFLFLVPAFALTLALLPQERFWHILLAQTVFAAYAFLGIVVVGAERRISTRALFAQLVVTSICLAGIVPLAMHVGSVQIFVYAGDADSVMKMTFYAPAFATFVVGFAAFIRQRVSSGLRARSILVGVTTLAVLAPVLTALALRLGGTYDAWRWALAMSPLSVGSSDLGIATLGVPSLIWAGAGATLLALSYRRERQEIRGKSR